MKTKKDKQGISLIVLVITIIVMIILAAAIILTLNNSGIINRANEAVEKSDLAQVKHIAALKWAEAYLDETIEGEEAYKSYIEAGLRESKINPDDYEITITAQGVEVALKEKVPSAWSQNVTAMVDTVPIPKGFIASPYEGEKTKSDGLVIYELGERETSIPDDETQHDSWITRNQYVWVPVPRDEFETKFIRKEFGVGYTLSNALGSDYWEVELDLTNMPFAEQESSYITIETAEGGITNTLAEVQAMYASVKEYGGFYIARYEAGIDTQRTKDNGVLETNVYSMMGKIPYTYIPWGKNNSMNEDIGGAVQAARSIYSVTNTEYGVVSTLTYGVQWDAVLQWWQDTNAVTALTSSTEYGNYSDHIINTDTDLNEDAKVATYKTSPTRFSAYVSKDDESIGDQKASGTTWALSTGALKAASVNNIYDMAGNMYEWTMEGYSTNTRITRGGCFSGNGTPGYSAVTNRIYNNVYNGFNNTSFRPALYIKK